MTKKTQETVTKHPELDLEQVQEKARDEDYGLQSAHEAADRRLLQAAEDGDRKAQFECGNACWQGRIPGKTKEDAVRWYRKAAEQNVSAAQYNLALAYWYGKGVERDYRRALQLFEQCAGCGASFLYLALGWWYGIGVPRNVNAAGYLIDWLLDFDTDYAHVTVGWYLLGCFVEYQLTHPNGSAASLPAEIYQRAADKGDPSAQYRLYRLLHLGIARTEKNEEKAKEWLRKARAQGVTSLEEADDRIRGMKLPDEIVTLDILYRSLY